MVYARPGSVESERVTHPASIHMTQLNRSHAQETGLNRSHAQETGLNRPHAQETGMSRSHAQETGMNNFQTREPRANNFQTREPRANNFQTRETGPNSPNPHRTQVTAQSNLQANLETILNAAERRALVAVLRSRPDLTLDKLQDCFTGRYGATLRTITIRELLETETHIELPDDGGPVVDRSALEQAKRLNGPAYDAYVLQAIRTAGGEPVSASYLRARVGGPRWKLQGPLRRLVDAGEVERDGITSSTRYRGI
jgi:hypothetical protein